MKRLLPVTLIFFLTTGLFAQDSYFGINLGTGIPRNEFSSVGNLFTNGYAQNGFSIQFDGIYFPGSIFGFGGIVGFGSIYPDGDSYLTDFVGYISTNSSFNGVNIPAEEDFNISTGFWNYFNLMTGPELGVDFWRIQIGVRAMAGASFLIYPRMEISYSDDFDDFDIQAHGNSLRLGYTYGGSLMFKLNRGSSVKVGVDYFGSKSRSDFDLNYDGIVGVITDSQKQDVKVDVIHISLGLNYLF